MRSEDITGSSKGTYLCVGIACAGPRGASVNPRDGLPNSPGVIAGSGDSTPTSSSALASSGGAFTRLVAVGHRVVIITCRGATTESSRGALLRCKLTH
eukprot:9430332-Pyramimonas_sp.AAC.1